MESDLAGVHDGISERFVADRDRGRLIEAEHLARYHWAAPAAAGAAVLDAGCGTGYGAAILAAAGAREVVGIDLAADVLTAAAPALPDSVTLQAGDLHDLPFDDDRFDLVVCFEAIEHLRNPMTALDELRRVLAPDGSLLISSPNRLVYPAGNPHHVHEFAPAEFETALADRFAHVRLLRQSTYLTAAILGDDTVSCGDATAVDGVSMRKLIAGTGGEETYTVAIASQADRADLPQLAMLSGTFELREWMSAADVQTQAITDKDVYIAELEQRVSERERIAALLTEAELALAGVPELREQIAILEHDLADARTTAELARREAAELDRALLYGRRLLRHVRPLVQLAKKVRRRLRGT